MRSNRAEGATDDARVADSTVRRPALARQRQALILEQVREHGAVRVADLVRALGVSDMTIRRDLELLHERGLLEKVHGGAAAIEGSSLFEPGFTVKSVTDADARRPPSPRPRPRSWRRAPRSRSRPARRPSPWAARLVDVPGLTVLTNSVPVADALYGKAGRIRRSS